MTDEPRRGVPFRGTRAAIAAALPVARALWPWLVLGVLVAVAAKALPSIDLPRVRALLHETEPARIALLLLVTATSLGVAGLYDVVALGSRVEPPSAFKRWSVGTVSFAWSNVLTIGPLAGPALRLWLYAPLGVSADRARRGLVRIAASFALSLGAWSLAVVAPLPSGAGGAWARGALAAALTATLALLASRLVARRTALALAGVGFCDWLLAWVAFHLAITSQVEGLPVPESLRVFFVGQLAGLVSFVPGGWGPADLFWAARLPGTSGGRDHVLAALFLYRTVYYLLPFAFASLFLAGRLVGATRRTAAVVRTGIASYAFVCGVVLLASAASPALRDRAATLEATIPLALVELSHGASIVLGFLLLLLSRGLARGYRGSQRLAVALFLAAAVTTFLKGLDYEEAGLALLAAALLTVFRGAFEREGRMHPSLEFLFSAGLAAVLLFAAVGAGSYGSWPSLPEAFSRFAFLAHEERFLRGLVLLSLAAAVAIVLFAQRPRLPDALPDAAAIARALDEVARHARGTSALLVATGDKSLFRRHPDEPEFVAYRTQGRFVVGWSDPVCGAGRERDLLAAFVEHAADWDREAVLYQISPALLPVAHDLGFQFFKLGEEAIVDLAGFDVRGNRAKAHRHVLNAVEKGGGGFQIARGDALASLLPGLRRVSERWLEAKGATEKGFSVGRFDEEYLLRFPCAVVADREGSILAFANVLEDPVCGELSVDLMRSDVRAGPLAPQAMEYLLLNLMLRGKDLGFRQFNLGMAPLAQVGITRRARPVERLARQFFLHGETWYNYRGLRRFKERFHPTWEPRYLAYRRPWDWPFAIAAVTQLISRGWRRIPPALALLCAVTAAAGAPATVVTEKKSLPGFGEVAITRPEKLGETRGVVLFVSGDGGWNLGVVAMAHRIAPHAIVAGLSMPDWQRRSEREGPACWYPAGELETAAQALEKAYGLPRYVPPILVGYSSGATVAYGALAMAPRSTFRGSVSVGFCPDLEVRRALCGTPDWSPRWDGAKHQSWLPEWTTMPEREGGGPKWVALQGTIDEVCSPQGTIDFVHRIPHAKVVVLDHVGHGFSVTSRWGSAFDAAVDGMLGSESVFGPEAAVAPSGTVPARGDDVTARLAALDLPLEVTWPEGAKAALVFVSGDGGWADLDSGVARRLAAHGIAVVGWNTLRYFWSKKSPERFAADLARVAAALPEGIPVFAGGYSSGAETMPVALFGTSPGAALPRRFSGLILLAPGRFASFEVSPLNWFRRGSAPTDYNVTDAITSSPVPVLCVATRGDHDSGCPPPTRPMDERIELPGGHHFGGDYDALAAPIVAFAKKVQNSPR